MALPEKEHFAELPKASSTSQCPIGANPVPHVVNILILFPNAHPHITLIAYLCIIYRGIYRYRYRQNEDEVSPEEEQFKNRGWRYRRQKRSAEERQDGGMIGRVSEL